jgi:hypothetical protein
LRTNVCAKRPGKSIIIGSGPGLKAPFRGNAPKFPAVELIVRALGRIYGKQQVKNRIEHTRPRPWNRRKTVNCRMDNV